VTTWSASGGGCKTSAGADGLATLPGRAISKSWLVFWEDPACAGYAGLVTMYVSCDTDVGEKFRGGGRTKWGYSVCPRFSRLSPIFVSPIFANASIVHEFLQVPVKCWILASAGELSI
jgi:hypothetical protein